MDVQPPEPQNSLPSEVPSRPCIKMHRFASLFEFFALRLPDATPPALSLPSGWRFHIHASSSDHFHIFAHSAAVRATEPNTTGGGLPRTVAQATHQNAPKCNTFSFFRPRLDDRPFHCLWFFWHARLSRQSGAFVERQARG